MGNVEFIMMYLSTVKYYTAVKIELTRLILRGIAIKYGVGGIRVRDSHNIVKFEG